MQDDAVALSLGLPGFRVLKCVETPVGLEISVETTAPAGLCPACHAVALEPKERPLVVVRDLPIQGLPTYLIWRKRRFRCPACGRSFTESCEEIPPRARTTRERSSPCAPLHAVEGHLLIPRDAPRLLGVDEAAHKKGQDYKIQPIAIRADPPNCFNAVEGASSLSLRCERSLRVYGAGLLLRELSPLIHEEPKIRADHVTQQRTDVRPLQQAWLAELPFDRTTEDVETSSPGIRATADRTRSTSALSRSSRLRLRN